MDEDYESEWTPIYLEKMYGYNKLATAISIQVAWYDVAGNFDGKIHVLCSNDLVNAANGMEINVSSASNLNDPHLIIMYPAFQYLKLKYVANAITEGVLNAIITYK